MSPAGMAVRVMIGATHAYACITLPGRSLDVRLNPARSTVASLRESAAENRERAARLIAQAELMDAAADSLAVADRLNGGAR